jgi:hypothetical protein
MTPVSADEKREIIRLFRELHAAIIHSRPDVDAKFKAYRGDLHAYLGEFDGTPDKARWVAQLGVYLLDEIDEPTFWKLPKPEEP